MLNESLLISSLPGKASNMLVESQGSTSLCLYSLVANSVNTIEKDQTAHLGAV